MSCGARPTVAVVNMTAAGLTATGVAAAKTTNISDTKTFQAVATTSNGAGAATVNIEGTLDGTHYDVVGTFNLVASTTGGSASFTSTDRYDKYQINVTAISGTNCSVVVQMGY